MNAGTVSMRNSKGLNLKIGKVDLEGDTTNSADAGLLWSLLEHGRRYAVRGNTSHQMTESRTGIGLLGTVAEKLIIKILKYFHTCW